MCYPSNQNVTNATGLSRLKQPIHLQPRHQSTNQCTSLSLDLDTTFFKIRVKIFGHIQAKPEARERVVFRWSAKSYAFSNEDPCDFANMACANLSVSYFSHPPPAHHFSRCDWKWDFNSLKSMTGLTFGLFFLNHRHHQRRSFKLLQISLLYPFTDFLLKDFFFCHRNPVFERPHSAAFSGNPFTFYS